MSSIIDIANAAVTPLFRDHYHPLMMHKFPQSSPVLGMVRKSFDATGEKQVHHIPTSTIGGFKAGGIGDAGDAEFLKTSYDTITVTQIGRVDAKTIEQSRDLAGAAAKATAQTVMLMKREISRNKERMLVDGDTTGALGTIDTGGVTDNGGGSYTLTISSATWIRNNFHRRILLNVDTSTDRFVCTAVDAPNKQLTILRQTGSKVPSAGEILYMHESKDNEYEGLKGALTATSGTLYGVTVSPDAWESTHFNASSAAVSSDMLVQVAYNILEECGEMPNVLLASQTQIKKIIALGEANKTLSYDSVSSGQDFVLGNVPHLMVEGRRIPIIYSQFMSASTLYFLNSKHMELKHLTKGGFVPGFSGGFLTYEGQLLKNDVFTILWKEYSTPFIDPRFHGDISNLNETVTA